MPNWLISPPFWLIIAIAAFIFFAILSAVLLWALYHGGRSLADLDAEWTDLQEQQLRQQLRERYGEQARQQQLRGR